MLRRDTSSRRRGRARRPSRGVSTAVMDLVARVVGATSKSSRACSNCCARGDEDFVTIRATLHPDLDLDVVLPSESPNPLVDPPDIDLDDPYYSDDDNPYLPSPDTDLLVVAAQIEREERESANKSKGSSLEQLDVVSE